MTAPPARSTDHRLPQGGEPDFTLAFPETLYDREGLTDYINNLR